MTPLAPAKVAGDGHVIALSTLLHRLAVEQSRLAGLVLALQDILSPRDGSPAYGVESIRGLQSVDLVTQSLNDLARLTHAIAARAGDIGTTATVADAVTRIGAVAGPAAFAGSGLPQASLAFDIRPLREALTLGDLAERVLGSGPAPSTEDESDIVWLDELASSPQHKGTA